MWDDKSADKLEKMLAGNFTPELIHKLSAEETAEKIGLPIDMASFTTLLAVGYALLN